MMKRIVIIVAFITTTALPITFGWNKKTQANDALDPNGKTYQDALKFLKGKEAERLKGSPDQYNKLLKETNRLVNDLERYKKENAQLKKELSELRAEQVAKSLQHIDQGEKNQSSKEQETDDLANILNDANDYVDSDDYYI